MPDLRLVANLPDDLHCSQACFKMILEVTGHKDLADFSTIDKATGFIAGKLTWPMQGIMWLAELGYHTVLYDPMSYSKTATEGYTYLKQFFGTDLYEVFQRDSDMDQAIEDCQKIIEHTDIQIHEKLPTLLDLTALLEQGYYCMCYVNNTALDGREGFFPHMVIVKSITVDTAILNNPGLPAIENQRVPIGIFERAWGDPDPTTTRALYAFRPKVKV